MYTTQQAAQLTKIKVRDLVNRADRGITHVDVSSSGTGNSRLYSIESVVDLGIFESLFAAFQPQKQIMADVVAFLRENRGWQKTTDYTYLIITDGNNPGKKIYLTEQPPQATYHLYVAVPLTPIKEKIVMRVRELEVVDA